MRVLFALAALGPLIGQGVAQEVDPTDVLIRFRDRVLASGERIPNYTCVETVTRDTYEPALGPAPKSCDSLLARRKTTGLGSLLKLTTTDRLRLDVALADGREILSWAGAPKFEEGDIDELIPDGSMGTGAFAAMLLSVFRAPGARYFLEPGAKLDGRSAVEYSFSVPLEGSHYRVKAGREWVITGYSGTLWLDPKTAEMARMTVRTDELPPASNTCETQTTLEYSPVQLRGASYLLPSKTVQRFIGRDGSESENTITFASCREYRGESTLSFDSAPAPVGPPEPVSSPIEWPTGLPVTIDLDGAVHSNRAAAGDIIHGRLARPVAGVPAGAAVEGRLMRVEVRHGSRPVVTISLRWETVEANGTRVPLRLAPQRKVADPKPAGRLAGRIEIELPPVADSRYGFYRFSGAQAVMDAGFRTEWTTTRP